MVAPGRDEKYSADNPKIARAREPSTSAVVLIPIEAVTEYAECRGGGLALQHRAGPHRSTGARLQVCRISADPDKNGREKTNNACIARECRCISGHS